MVKLKSMDKKEETYNRPQRKEIDRINHFFEPLMDRFMDTRVKYGDTEEVAELMGQLDRTWKHFANKHNHNRKNVIKANPEAFTRQVEAILDMEKTLAAQVKKDREKKDFEKWKKKMKAYFPWNLRILCYMNYVKFFDEKDHVKKYYEKLQGQSPVGRWY